MRIFLQSAVSPKKNALEYYFQWFVSTTKCECLLQLLNEIARHKIKMYEFPLSVSAVSATE